MDTNKPAVITSVDFLNDWALLCSLPFQRQKRIGHVFKRLYQLIDAAKDHPDYKWLLLMKKWLLVPFSLWSIPCDGMAGHICKRIENGERLSPQILWMLELLEEDLPSLEEQKMIADFERCVEEGDYDHLVPGHAKFEAMEKALLNDPHFKKRWEEFKQLFNLENLRDGYDILRRTPAQERNFRGPGFKWNSQEEEAFAQTALDLFCARFTLFGIEGEHPLLQKLTLNPTSLGWIMFWPIYWSPDARRDFNWPFFTQLQRIRGVMRQGAKMSEGRVERQDDARIAFEASQEADERGYRGERRKEHILRKVGLSLDTDDRTLRRLIAEGRLEDAYTAVAAELTETDQETDAKPQTPARDVSESNLKLTADSEFNKNVAAFKTWSPEKQAEFLKQVGVSV